MLDRSLIEKQARELRRAEIIRFSRYFESWINVSFASISDFFRGRHEAMLRRRPRNLRMRSANPTPA